MTTNQNIVAIKIELGKAAQKDINIQINYQIDSCVNFLDVTLLNRNGNFKTTLYHKTTAEPYILPYTSDHPQHVHRNIPFAALLRAARLCSDVQDFNKELICIDMSLLLSTYPKGESAGTQHPGTSAPAQHLGTFSAPAQHLDTFSAPAQHLDTFSAPQHLSSTSTPTQHLLSP
ncbi:unnamed protein product, partial [Rotaria sp. Silwood2]